MDLDFTEGKWEGRLRGRERAVSRISRGEGEVRQEESRPCFLLDIACVFLWSETHSEEHFLLSDPLIRFLCINMNCRHPSAHSSSPGTFQKLGRLDWI